MTTSLLQDFITFELVTAVATLDLEVGFVMKRRHRLNLNESHGLKYYRSNELLTARSDNSTVDARDAVCKGSKGIHSQSHSSCQEVSSSGTRSESAKAELKLLRSNTFFQHININTTTVSSNNGQLQHHPRNSRLPPKPQRKG
jgi:hypothetical protein